MKEWFLAFWKKHGENILFLGAALVMAVSCYCFTQDLKETGKTVIIGILMYVYNHARSQDNQKQTGGSNEAKAE